MSSSQGNSQDWIDKAENFIDEENMKKVRSAVGEERFDKYEKQAHDRFGQHQAGSNVRSSGQMKDNESTGGMMGSMGMAKSSKNKDTSMMDPQSESSGMGMGIGKGMESFGKSNKRGTSGMSDESFSTSSNAASGMKEQASKMMSGKKGSSMGGSGSEF